jgi:hypothetical protein
MEGRLSWDETFRASGAFEVMQYKYFGPVTYRLIIPTQTAFFAPKRNGQFVPYWLIVFVIAPIAAIPWLRARFSLRTLVIATTLVAVVLGLAVWATRN